jgi:hypothetical protein
MARQESNLRTRIRRLLTEVLICRGNLVDMRAARHFARHSRYFRSDRPRPVGGGRLGRGESNPRRKLASKTVPNE